MMQWAVGVARKALAEISVPADAPKQEQDLAAKLKAGVTQQLAESQSALARLQAYLLPRLMQLDAIAIAAAQSRGDADVRELLNMQAQCDACVARAREKTPAKPDDSACRESECKRPAAQDRLQACKNPAWLPF